MSSHWHKFSVSSEAKSPYLHPNVETQQLKEHYVFTVRPCRFPVEVTVFVLFQELQFIFEYTDNNNRPHKDEEKVKVPYAIALEALTIEGFKNKTIKLKRPQYNEEDEMPTSFV